MSAFPKVPILFLDFDGVVCTTRAHLAFRQWSDPIAFGLIKQLCVEHFCQIVVTSTWRTDARCLPMLAAHHLLDHLHVDWAVDDDNNSRSATITRWLDKNGDHPYVIIDDERCDFTDEQKRWFVHTNMDYGFGLHDYARTERYLKLFDYSNRLQAAMAGEPYVGSDDEPLSDMAHPAPQITLSNLAQQAQQALLEGDLDGASSILDMIRDHPLAQ